MDTYDGHDGQGTGTLWNHLWYTQAETGDKKFLALFATTNDKLSGITSGRLL